MKIRFRCSCGQSYTVDEKLAGKRVKCTSCGKPVRVPGGAEEPDTESARPDHPPQPARSRSAAVAAAPVAKPRGAAHAGRNQHPADGAARSHGSAQSTPRKQPVAHNRYQAMTDRRHGRSSNAPFIIGGAFAVAVIGVVIIAIILIATPDDKPATPATPDTASAAPGYQTPVTPPTPAAPDKPDKPAATDAEPTKTDAPKGVAPNIEDTEVKWGEMQAGPWELRVSSIEILDQFTCPAKAVTNANGGKPLIVKPTRSDYKLAVISLSAKPKRPYTPDERAALEKLSILAQGERKIADDEWVLASDHLKLACIDPNTGVRAALPPLLMYPEQADAGIAIAGSNVAAYYNFAVFTDEDIDLVAVYEVNPADTHLLLIPKPTPQTLPTPAFRLTLSPAGTLSSNPGFADLVKFDPALAPGERRPGPASPTDEPQPPAQSPAPTDKPEAPAADPAAPTDGAESPANQ